MKKLFISIIINLLVLFSELHSDLDKIEKPKMFILISTVMTWAKSKPLDPVSIYRKLVFSLFASYVLTSFLFILSI